MFYDKARQVACLPILYLLCWVQEIAKTPTLESPPKWCCLEDSDLFSSSWLAKPAVEIFLPCLSTGPPWPFWIWLHHDLSVLGGPEQLNSYSFFELSKPLHHNKAMANEGDYLYRVTISYLQVTMAIGAIGIAITKRCNCKAWYHVTVSLSYDSPSCCH